MCVYIYNFFFFFCKSGWSCDQPGLHVKSPLLSTNKEKKKKKKRLIIDKVRTNNAKIRVKN